MTTSNKPAAEFARLLRHQRLLKFVALFLGLFIIGLFCRGLFSQGVIENHHALSDDAKAYLQGANALLGADFSPASVFSLFRIPAYTIGVLAPPLALFKLFPALGDQDAYLAFIRLEQTAFWALGLALMLPVCQNLLTDIEENRLARRYLPWIAVLLGLSYYPLLLQSDRLLSETAFTTCLLLCLWCWQSGRFRAGGFLLAITLLLHRAIMVLPTLAMFVLLYWALGFLFKCENKPLKGWEGVKQAFLWFLPPCALIFMLMNVLPQTSLDTVYLWQFDASSGWMSLSRLPESFGHLDFFKIVDIENSTPVEGFRLFLANPLHMLSQYFNNAERLLLLPENPYWQSGWILKPGGLLLFHWALLLGLLWLLPQCANNAQRAKKFLPFLAIVLTLCLAYAITKIECRYFLPAMPVVIILSVCGWRAFYREAANGGWLRFVFAMCAVLISLACFAIAIGASVPDTLWSRLALSLHKIFVWPLQLLLLSPLCACLFMLARVLRFSKRCLVLIALVGLHLALCWHQFNPPLFEESRPLQAAAPITQSIDVDEHFWQRLSAPANPAQVYTTFLAIDITPVLDLKSQPLGVEINGRSIPLTPYTEADLPRALLEHPHLLGGQKPFDALRQYRYIRIPEHFFSGKSLRHLVVKIGDPGGRYAIKVDFPAGMPERDIWTYNIPSPDWGDYSIYRALALGEGRKIISAQKAQNSSAARYRMWLLQLPKEHADPKNDIMFGHFYPTPAGSAEPIAKAFYQYY